jgi:predicted negative regulator of RcsB-dependent stress response
MTTGFRTLLIAAVALVVAAVLGYWAYGTHQKSGVGKEAMALAQETGRHLRAALNTEADRPSTETVEAIGEYATAANRNLEAVKRLDAAGNQALVDALDDTLLTSREILGRQAAAYRFRRQLLASTQALRDHMRADNRTGAWVREAVQGKERVEKDYRDYLGAAEALDKLLESFPASLARLASRSGAAPLVDDKLVAEARKRSNTALQQATDEVEKIRQFTVRR